MVLATLTTVASTEQYFHEMFKASWSHGEWFRPTPDLLKLIGEIPTNEDTGALQYIENRTVSRRKRTPEETAVNKRQPNPPARHRQTHRDQDPMSAEWTNILNQIWPEGPYAFLEAEEGFGSFCNDSNVRYAQRPT